MVKKRLSDLLQEEAEKFTPGEEESAIEVTAEEIAEARASAAEESSTKAPESTATRRINPTKADLEITIKELKETIEKSQQKEASLEQQIVDLQSDFSEQQAAVERLTKELYEAKKTALQLAEANSKLIEENNAFKQPKEPVKEPAKELAKEPAKGTSKLVNYRKSYRLPENLPTTQPEQAADTAAQMWLLD